MNLVDYAILVEGYGCNVAMCGDPRADLQPDGWLDVLDYLVIIQHWYEGPSCRPFCEPSEDAAGGGGAPNIAGGGAGGEAWHAADLDGSGCVDVKDLALLAPSYGCDASCASPGTDIVPDGCVNDDDFDVWEASQGQQAACSR